MAMIRCSGKGGSIKEKFSGYSNLYAGGYTSRTLSFTASENGTINGTATLGGWFWSQIGYTPSIIITINGNVVTTVNEVDNFSTASLAGTYMVSVNESISAGDVVSMTFSDTPDPNGNLKVSCSYYFTVM